MTTLFDPTPYQSITDLPAMAELDGELDRLSYMYVMGADSPDIARSNLMAVGNWLAAQYDNLAEPWPLAGQHADHPRCVAFAEDTECIFPPSAIVLDFRH